MGKRLQRLGEVLLPGKNPKVALVITVIAAAFMLSGLGSAIMDAHDSFAKTDRLAAISQIISGVPDGALPVTLLDVDDATRQAWKSTGVTPHAALAELVRTAANNGAKGILLDFDLTLDTPGAPADDTLFGLIRAYPADAPVLMLVRRIGFTKSAKVDDTALVASELPTPYDEAVAAKPNVVWVTTLNEIGADRAVRQIRLWQTVCNGAEGRSYPSPALVTAALFGATNHGEALKAFLANRVAEECGERPVKDGAWPPMKQQLAQLPYVFGNDAASPARLRIEQADGSRVVALRRISAGKLVTYDGVTAAPAGEIDRDPFAGRVAVIGASYTESTDVHETPLGNMPGSVVLANSIVQAERLASTVPASSLVRNIFAFELFLIFAVCARYFVGVIALLGIGVSSVAALVIISRLFGYESAVDSIGAAITGFALFKLVEALATMAINVRKNGWRVILKG